ncbi:MAG: hypothetical protein HF976_14180 [ANME-2 cluster archaeon]|nr:hypothetical protein [ANME-2 cluster archaeon]MBC2702522.1 hypothetical protein [ANME-2 cluster archaeon]MBC2746812.1 hypothetical protein [ANME-2 cluster archaeon]MBC2761756.1 hypothetical protein [ANME-2 cluster archaeon]
MKILDSSPVIAFYTELNEPDMLHKFIELGYELSIPRSVFKEIENGRTSEPLKSNIAHGNIEIMASLPEEDIFHFKNRYPYLGYGEIIDDQRALEYLSNKPCVKKEDYKKIAKMKKEVARKQTLLPSF